MQLLVIPVIFILIINVLFGMKRGLGKTVVRLITMLASVFIAFFLAKGLCRAFGDTALMYVQTALESNAELSAFIAENPDVLTSLGVLAEVLVAPLLFFICYTLLKTVTFFAYIVICGVFGIGKKENRTSGSRLTGMAVGVVAGMVTVFVLTVPLLGYATLASEVLVSLDENGLAGETELSQYDEAYLTPLREVPICATLYQTVGEPFFDGLTTGEIDEEKVVLRGEVLTLLDIAGEARTLAGKDISTYSDAESDLLRRIATDMGDSVLLTHVGAAALRDLSTKWLAGESFLGIARPTINENADIIINGFLQMFSTSDAQNISADLTAFADVFALCTKYDLFSKLSSEASDDALLACLNSGFLPELQALIKSCPRMTPIYSALSDVGMRYMIDAIGIPANYAEEYPELMDDMAGAVRSLYDEEGNIDKETFTAGISSALEGSGVELPAAAVDIIADGIAETIAETFTKEEVESMEDAEIVETLVERFGSAEAALEAAKKLQDTLGTTDISSVTGGAGATGTGTATP